MGWVTLKALKAFVYLSRNSQKISPAVLEKIRIFLLNICNILPYFQIVLIFILCRFPFCVVCSCLKYALIASLTAAYALSKVIFDITYLAFYTIWQIAQPPK